MLSTSVLQRDTEMGKQISIFHTGIIKTLQEQQDMQVLMLTWEWSRAGEMI